MNLIRHLLADIGALLRFMKTHDLNARTLELAHEKGLTFADARRELARHIFSFKVTPPNRIHV